MNLSDEEIERLLNFLRIRLREWEVDIEEVCGYDTSYVTRNGELMPVYTANNKDTITFHFIGPKGKHDAI